MSPALQGIFFTTAPPGKFDIHIFKRIKDLEYTQSIINDEKVYTFKTKISEFDTTIRIYTGRKNISRIDIENGVMTYILKYKNIKS